MAVAAPRLMPATESEGTARNSGVGGGTTGLASRTRTLSRCGSDGDPGTTLLLVAQVELAGATDASGAGTPNCEDLRQVVAHLEDLQAKQISIQQPNPRIDAIIARTLALRPELRQRMAVMTKSILLRQKILGMVPSGVRVAGSATLGVTHPWRTAKLADTFSDHNWPKATLGKSGMHMLEGGTASHDLLLRCPAEKQRMHPLLSNSANYSVPRAKRFFGTLDNGELDKNFVQKRNPPGPASYFKTAPHGTAFNTDGGETVVLGANHVCPWKTSLGRQINPIDVDATTLTSAPCYSFSRTRRTVTETAFGHGLQEGGPVKSDRGALSPGPVYETYGSMRPLAGPAFGKKERMRSRSTPGLGCGRPVRCVPMAVPESEMRAPLSEQADGSTADDDL